MSPETQKLLEKFSSLANWGTPGNPEDMERFSDFVISAYRKGEHDISLDEFLDVVNSQIRKRGDAEDLKTRKRDLASKMFMWSKYEDAIRLLLKFEGK